MFDTAHVPDVDDVLLLVESSFFDAILFEAEAAAAAGTRLRHVRKVAPDTALLFAGALDAELADLADGRLDGVTEPARVGADVCRGVLRRLRVQMRQARESLHETDSRFHSIIERMADGIVVVDRDGRVQYANRGAERIFGRSSADLLGEEFGFAILSGETAEMDIVRSGATEPLTTELRASLTTWDGRPAQIISLRDISDRWLAQDRAQRLLLERSAREDAEQASRRWQLLAEAGATLDASLDPERTLASLAHMIVPRLADWCVIDLVEGGRFRRVAGAHSDADRQHLLEELTMRYPPSADTSQPAVRVVRTGEPELHLGLDPQRVRELAVDDTHAELMSRLGVRSSMTVPLHARERCLGAITFVCAERDFDESDLVLAEEIATRAGTAIENAQLHEAALQANKAKADFLTVMSHELRTPLNAILGYTELLLEGVTGPLDEAQEVQLRRIHASAAQLLQIVGEILIYASMEAAGETPTAGSARLGEVIAEIAAIAEPLARDKGLTFSQHVEHPEASLFTDTAKVRQIMLSLLTNAVKFTEEGSVELTARSNGEEVALAVRDTGCGIPQDQLPHIFSAFWQAEDPLTRHVGGIGLGLAVARRFARLLGGDIHVESAAGAGSTFTLRFPARLMPVPGAA
ncbi:ATP-binding protein [soil metagenome]